MSDLPPKPAGFWRMAGPSAVLVGLAVGAGELVVWPVMTARFGADLAWAATLGVAMQLAINIEAGRYTLATGESAYGAFARLRRGWVPVFLLLNLLGWILPGWARTCAGALKALVVGPNGPGEPWIWTAATFCLVGFVLFGPKNAYRQIERITITLITVMFAGLVAVAWKIGDAGSAAELLSGITRIGYKPADLPAYELFSAIVFAGAGGTTNLMFCYYLRDKGWGMAGAEHPSAERPEDGAIVSRDTEQNRQRWSEWFGHMVRDQTLFFWLMNSLTILLFMYAALVVLHPSGTVPGQEMLLLEEARLLGEIWGTFGLYLFLVIGIACLFTTQLTLLDGVARSCTDLLRSNWPRFRDRPEKSLYRGIAAGWMVTGVALTWAWGSLPPFMFLLSAGFFGGIAMATYCPLLWLANRTLIPEHCRPGPAASLVFAAISAFYVLFAVASLVIILPKVFTG